MIKQPEAASLRASAGWSRETRATSSLSAAVSAKMRVDYGPGYRIYFASRGSTLIILLCGGDKKTQTADIKRAKALAREI